MSMPFRVSVAVILKNLVPISARYFSTLLPCQVALSVRSLVLVRLMNSFMTLHRHAMWVLRGPRHGTESQYHTITINHVAQKIRGYNHVTIAKCLKIQERRRSPYVLDRATVTANALRKVNDITCRVLWFSFTTTTTILVAEI